MCENFVYCPICQLPLKAISISPDIHVSLCMSKCDEGEVEECPKGVHCLSTDVFHYRDFSHKLLAAYRSSAHFVPPEVEIKRSPIKKRKTPLKVNKRVTPRKTKTPEKVEQKSCASDSESEDENLIQTKKPRRSLRFCGKNQASEKDSTNLLLPKPKPPLKTCSKNNKPKSNLANPSLKSNSAKLSAKSNSVNPNQRSIRVNRRNASQPFEPRGSNNSESKDEVTRGNCDTVLKDNVVKLSEGGDNCCSKSPIPSKLTVANVRLNTGEEIFMGTIHSRSQSPLSSMSISTSATSKVDDSDLDSVTTLGSNKPIATCSTPKPKVLLKEPLIPEPKALLNEPIIALPKTSLNSSESLLKEPVLSLVKLDHSNNKSLNSSEEVKTADNLFESENEADSTIESETNVSLSKTDFDDVIPGSTLDKKLLKTLQLNKKELAGSSPATTLHTCSEYNGTPTSVSSTVEDDLTEYGNSTEELSDRSNSPDVFIPTRPTVKTSTFLSSSSDSDVPLASFVSNKIAKEKHLEDQIKGKEKAGKILRTPSKAPVYVLNGSSIKEHSSKDEINPPLYSDSDSGKSSASKDNSFIPSDRNSSSNISDSAFSAESTDRLTASSHSSTYVSSEDTSYETQSSDPSYCEKIDVNINIKRDKAQNSQKYNQRPGLLSSSKRRLARPIVYSESSSSEISIKEKLFFSKKKSPPKSNIKVEEIKYSSTASHGSLDCNDKTEWQILLNKMRNGCFPSDLKIDSEDSLTVASSCSDTSYASMLTPLRQCPFYKRIPDTPFAVDAFQYWNIPGVKVYFLSHFHSDHYIGLKKSFSHPIYCTKITANLIRLKLHVADKWLHVLELNKPQIISGVEVTALDANHCPGSMMLLFSLTNGQVYLHVGDFRASKEMMMSPSLQRISVSKLFLDTTYCSPQYCFPTQEVVISKLISIVRDKVKQHPCTLVVCGSYLIGKEKLFLGIAEALDWRIWARPEKQRVFMCLNDKRIVSRLVKDPRAANVHVMPMASINVMTLHQHLQSCSGVFAHVIGVKPTGWELNSKSQDFKVTVKDNITVYGVPYSEHSSFPELRGFVQFLQPHEVVPTVNVGSVASRDKMSKHFSEWQKQNSSPSKKGTQRKVSQYFKSSRS